MGSLAIASVSFLPIDKNSVSKHTLDKVVRKLVSNVKGTVPAKTPIRLSVELDAELAQISSKNKIETLVLSTRVKSGNQIKAQFTPDETGRTLRLQINQTAGSIAGTLTWRDQAYSQSQRTGDWKSLLPPLIALLIAISFKKIVLALLLAVMGGAMVMNGGVAVTLWLECKALIGGLLSIIGIDAIGSGGYLGSVISDSFNLQILGFTLALVGLVAVVNRMGGTRGLVDALSVFARGPRSAQGVTCAMGTAIFFDDYANTVVVGTTARSLTDKHKISREKLAYIVDSTSAPVAGIAIISTWIGYEVGLFDDLLGSLSNVSGIPGTGYELFFSVLPFRFYCILAILFVIINAWTGRDFGPMLRAERRTRMGGPLGSVEENMAPDQSFSLAKGGIPYRAYNAVVPIGSVLVTILLCIIYIGQQDASTQLSTLDGWQKTFEAASDHIQTILIGAALVGSFVAFTLALVQRLLTFKESIEAYLSGMKTLSEAAAILILAWAIKTVCDDLGTGMTLVALVGDSFAPAILPLIIFVLSGLVAFSTGSSWATMALVLPIAAPLSATISGDSLIVFACLAAVLDGAIWGDHCSPISDTTILSSTATGCPHIEHVRTQIPYAMVTMLAAGSLGYFGVVAGLSLAGAYLGGAIILALTLLTIGRRADSLSTQTSA
ncbi:MAG: Na+/H+ antiporter NhaC family protein [Myxococcota bacterium]|nr:Na+/H+ antiporter NhaC family protein [Myxococcota bacterium]